jgi:hypothetical protein
MVEGERYFDFSDGKVSFVSNCFEIIRFQRRRLIILHINFKHLHIEHSLLVIYIILVCSYNREQKDGNTGSY